MKSRLTLIKEVERCRHNKRQCLYKCSCGNTKIINKSVVDRLKTLSCGCLQKEIALISISKVWDTNLLYPNRIERNVWLGMKRRCELVTDKAYPNYGGRGIYIDQRWSNSYESFLEDMGLRPSVNHSLDRIDNDGPYSFDNCRWSTREEQGNNRRSNVRIFYNNKNLTIAQWSKLTGIARHALYYRNKQGWSVEKMLTTPTNKQEKNNV